MSRRRKISAPRITYTDRVHMKRAIQRTDFKFLAALVAVIAAFVLALRYLG